MKMPSQFYDDTEQVRAGGHSGINARRVVVQPPAWR